MRSIDDWFMSYPQQRHPPTLKFKRWLNSHGPYVVEGKKNVIWNVTRQSVRTIVKPDLSPLIVEVGFIVLVIAWILWDGSY